MRCRRWLDLTRLSLFWFISSGQKIYSDRAKIYTLTTRGNHQLVQMTTQLQNTWRAPSFLSIPSFPKLDLFNLEQREGVGFHLGIGYQALTPRHLESWTWLGVYADLHLNQDLEYWQSSQGLKWTHLHAQHIVNWDLTLSLPGGNSIGFCSTDISWKKWPIVSL